MGKATLRAGEPVLELLLSELAVSSLRPFMSRAKVENRVPLSNMERKSRTLQETSD